MTTQISLIPTASDLNTLQIVAKQASQSKFYTSLGGESGIMMILLAARELGIPPMQALNGGIHIIQGKVEISARMMGAMIRKSGHKIIIEESTNEICVLKGVRGDTKETETTSFTIAEAQRAGLVKAGGGWTKYPQDMCFARALSRLARRLFSDVVGIGYVEGEISQKEIEISALVENQPVNEPLPIEEQKSEVKPVDKEIKSAASKELLQLVENEKFGLNPEEMERFEKGLIDNHIFALETATANQLALALDGIRQIKSRRKS